MVISHTLFARTILMYELSLSLSRLYSAAQRDLYWLSQLGLQRMGWNPCNFCPRWTSVLIMHVVLTRVVRLHPETTKSYLTPTWFEHATFWSGVRRATVAPRSLHAGHVHWIGLYQRAHTNCWLVMSWSAGALQQNNVPETFKKAMLSTNLFSCKKSPERPAAF